MFAPPIVAHFTFPSSLIFKKPTIKDSKNLRVNNPAQRKSSISLVSLSPIPRFSSPSFLSLIFVFSAPHFFLSIESFISNLNLGLGFWGWANSRWSIASWLEARWSSPSTLSSPVISRASHRNVSRNFPLPITSSPTTAMATPSITSLRTASVRCRFILRVHVHTNYKMDKSDLDLFFFCFLIWLTFVFSWIRVFDFFILIWYCISWWYISLFNHFDVFL